MGGVSLARRVFFSYHFDRDAWRANQVRHSWVPAPNREAAGFFDAADQEEVKRATDEAIKKWIRNQLNRTSVTAVLIGEETASREYVQYEIEQSFKRGNALLGIRIHNVKNRQGNTGSEGHNPLKDYVIKTDSGNERLSDVYPTYDWVQNDGKQNIGNWVEEAKEADEEIQDEWRDQLERKEGLSLLQAAAWGAAAGIGYKVVSEVLENLPRNVK